MVVLPRPGVSARISHTYEEVFPSCRHEVERWTLRPNASWGSLITLP